MTDILKEVLNRTKQTKEKQKEHKEGATLMRVAKCHPVVSLGPNSCYLRSSGSAEIPSHFF